MTEFKFNVNDKIKVKLTDRGRRILKHHIIEGNKLCGLNEDFVPSCYQEDKEGYIYPQLWDFMNIFGHYFANGAPLVIENNRIIFNVEN